MKKLIGSILIMAISMQFIACNGGFTNVKPTSTSSEETNAVVSGGVTDRTDYDAKKEIESKNIVEFFTSFFIYDKYEAGNDGELLISIKNNDKNEHVLSVQGVYNHSFVVGDDVLAGVQEIIDKYALVEKNGINKVTAGLAPEYGPWELKAIYDSDEKLYFRENGGPDGDWSGTFRDYFVQVMIEAGYEDVLPPKEALTITHFGTSFEKDGNSHHYGVIAMPSDSGDVDYFWHIAGDMKQDETIIEDYAEITEELFDGLQRVIEENNMFILHAPETVSFNLEQSIDGFLEFYVDYENGRQIYCEYSAEELPEEWPEMRDVLMEYLDQYIEAHKVDLGDE